PPFGDGLCSQRIPQTFKKKMTEKIYCVLLAGCLYFRQLSCGIHMVGVSPLSRGNRTVMGVEDISDSDPSIAQSRSSNEEKQSVQASIAIKGTRNGLLLTLEP